MPIFFRGQKKVLFIHIPKTGGSSVEDVLCTSGIGCMFSIRGFHPSGINFLSCSPQHYHAEILETIFVKENFDLIVHIFRDPFDRLKSEYYWHNRQKLKPADPIVWVETTFEEYKRNQFLNDNHIRPQVEFLVRTGNEEVLKLENNGVEKAIARIQSCLGVKSERWIAGKIRGIRKLFHQKKSVKSVEVENAFKEISERIYSFYEEDKRFYDSIV